jgi:hypothetical protein
MVVSVAFTNDVLLLCGNSNSVVVYAAAETDAVSFVHPFMYFVSSQQRTPPSHRRHSFPVPIIIIVVDTSTTD